MCVLYKSHWRHIHTVPEPNLNKFTKINDITTHHIIAQIKYSIFETEPNVMKQFKQNNQIQVQVQIRLVKNYKIQFQSYSINKLQIRRIFIQIHVHLWKRIRHFKILQSIGFAYDVGIISSAKCMKYK